MIRIIIMIILLLFIASYVINASHHVSNIENNLLAVQAKLDTTHDKLVELSLILELNSIVE